MEPNPRSINNKIFLLTALLYGSVVLNYVAYLHLFLYSGKAAEWLHLSMDNRRIALFLLAYVPMILLMASAVVMIRRFWQSGYRWAKGVNKWAFICWAIIAILLSVVCAPEGQLAFSWCGVVIMGAMYVTLCIMVWSMDENKQTA